MLSTNVDSNKRIARNTMMLYFRMGISMLVGLYTSRVILQILGVGDYGIYGVVGSVVAMLSFLNTSMAGATSRFLTFELGKGNTKKLSGVFSTALWIHIGIALIVLIFAETIGLWVIEKKLTIPQDRMFAAHVAYQCSVLSAMVSITQVPFNASIISHERMDVYAYVEVANTFLKLFIVYLLYIGNFDKLIQYSVLVLFVSIGIALYYRYYAVKNFEEVTVRLVFDKSIAREISTYTIYSLFSTFAWVGKRNIVVMLVNMFFGVAVNAAAALATTVSGVIQVFSSNIITAIRPPLVTLYAQDKKEDFLLLFYRAVSLMVFIMGICAVPIVLEMDYLLALWLKEVPEWTSGFCKLSLLSTPLIMAESVVNIANSANGKIGLQSAFSGSALLIQIPIIYIAFCFTGYPLCSEIVAIVFSLILFCGSSYCVKRNIPYISLKRVVVSGVLAFALPILTGVFVWYIQQYYESTFIRFVLVILGYELLALSLGYFLLLDKQARIGLNTLIKRYIVK